MEPKKALVVDDSKSARFAMRKHLECAGFQVEAAESAEEAFAMLRNHLPDVLFLDHVMPDIDGFQALSILRQDARTAALPVVLCSSNEGSEFVRTAHSRGATAVLLKPPSPRQLAEVLLDLDPLDRRPAAPAATSNKVLPIREPELAIEQAVMKTLRDALPVGSGAQPNLRVVATGPQPPVLGAIRSVSATARPDSVRAEMESRLKAITHDLYSELATARAHLRHLDGELRREDQIQKLISDALEGFTSQILLRVETEMAALRDNVTARLDAQELRIEHLATDLRGAVAAEANAVSERVVMNAAARISDQIAESILNVLKPAPVRAQR